MASITNSSSPVPIFYDLLQYILNDSDDSVFDELASDSIPITEPKETPSRDLKRKTIDCLNQSDQPAAKKSLVSNPSSSTSKNSLIMSPSFREALINNINHIYEKVNASSLEKIQTHYANQLNVDLQEIKNIYLAVSINCPTANKPSVINTKVSLKSITIPPEFKENLVNATNRNFDKIKASHLEKIQTHFANQLNVDLQEVKNIYLAVSTNCPTASKPSVIKTKLPANCSILIKPAFKELVDSINRIFHITNKSLEEIQTHFANQLNVDLQEVKNIYLAVSTNCPTASKPSVINTKVSLKSSITMSPEFKEKLVNTINQIHEKASALSFEKLQTYYANRLNVDPQEVKNIYLAVSTNCPTASKPSVINTKVSLKNSITMSPEFKESLVNVINRTFDKIKAFHLEKIQIQYANRLNVDPQEVKNIYFFVSPHDSAIETTVLPRKLKKLDFSLEDSPTGKKLVISPQTKRNLADNINYLFRTTDKSLEAIQTSYANQFKIVLQDVKDVYLAISTDCPSADEISKIKIINDLI